MKCHSDGTGCAWFVTLAMLRRNEGPREWHVTDANLEHQNCVSVAKPSHKQLANHHVVQTAVSATPALATQDLAVQLKNVTMSSELFKWVRVSPPP